MIVYNIKNLSKTYPEQVASANKNISFQVLEGEIFGILGGNGAGKTTLIKQMVNLLAPTTGTIHLYSKPIASDALYVPSIVGYMPQESLALNQLTVAESLFYTAHLREMNRRDATAEQKRLLQLWQMEHFCDKYSSRLSGGQRRLLRLAVATAGSPKVLVLDEPTNDLDPQKRKLVWDILRRINHQYGTTIIFITHDAIEAEKIIERVGILHQGELIAIGTPNELKQNLSNKLRLEITFEPSQDPEIPLDITIHQLTPTRWHIYLEQHQLADMMLFLDMDHLNNMNLRSATLEDIYFHYVENDTFTNLLDTID